MQRTRARAVMALCVLLLAACSAAVETGRAPQPDPPDPHGPFAPPPRDEPREQPPVAPYPGVTFDNPGVHAPVDPRVDDRSTFGLDVDTASYTVAQRFIDDGYRPDPDAIRVEEFVNAFDGGYAPPEDGTFAISVDGADAPFAWPATTRLLRVGIRARDVADADRPPAALTFVVDTSGSMDMENRLGLVRRSLAMLVDQLRPSDTVSIVEYGTYARIVLEPTAVEEAWIIQDAIARLRPGGSTNAAAGLELGYDLARHAYREEGINRVVLASDGVANVGVTDASGILELIGAGLTDHIQLVTVGFGMGNYNDALMEQLADQGDGFYAYVDDLDEARRIFLEDLTGTLQTVALDARVQVTFDPALVRTYRLVGYENRAVADDAFRDDTIDAGAIGAGHQVTALYEVELAGGAKGALGTVNLRWIDPSDHEPREASASIDARSIDRPFDRATPRLKLAALVAAWASALRQDPWAAGVSLEGIAERVRDVQRELPDDPDVAELVQLTAESARMGWRDW